jgi:copper chaperone
MPPWQGPRCHVPGGNADAEHEMLLNVQKMSCNHCVRSVTAAVRALDPEAKVDVDLSSGTVWIDGRTDAEAAAAAIREEGYTVEVVQQ